MENNTNKISFKFDSTDWEGMLDLMKKHGNSELPFVGQNEDGESVEISICTDNISVRTFQNNGWVRLNVYHDDGYCEELFEGRWNCQEEDHVL